MNSFKKYAYALSLLALSSSPAFAAVTIPSAADPARAQEQITPTPLPPVTSGPQTTAPAVNPQEAPPGAEKINFVLTSLDIQGMSVYTDADVSPLYQPLIGKQISLVDIYHLANELTTRYRNDGYILTQVIVPPQHIKDGHITLRAVEGYIDEVHIQNNRLNTSVPSYYSRYGDLIQASKPLNEKVLEKYMLLMNDLPGVSAKSVLSPSPTVPGASDLTIVIDHKAFDSSAEMDDRGSLYIGREQYNVSTRLNNAFGENEGITVQGATSPGDLNSGTVSVTRPIGYLGTTLTVNGSVTRTTPGFTLAQFDIQGTTHDYSAAVMHPFIRSRDENLSGTAKFEYFDTDRTDNLGGPKIEDRLRILRLSLLYQNSDRFNGANTFTAELSKGIDVLDASRLDDANLTRIDGDPLFFKATFEAARVQHLTNTFDLYAAATGQKSPDDLLSSEEFGVGGANYGSAYDSSEITGRDGIAGRVELRVNPPPIPRVQQVQPYGFYDIGKVWDPQNSDPDGRIMSLASAGIGLRAALNNNLSGAIELAAPLTKRIEAGQSNQPRIFSTVTAKF